MPLFSRHDGQLVSNVPRTRAIMPFIMETTAESVVFFEQAPAQVVGLSQPGPSSFDRR